MSDHSETVAALLDSKYEYKTVIDHTPRGEMADSGATLYRGDSLEEAARAWAAQTYNDPNATGGITIQQWRGELMVRDGWVLHVHNGVTYLNPAVLDMPRG